MTRKYTKKDTAYWSGKGNKTRYVVKKSNVIFEDKGKHTTVRVISDKNKPFYNRKSV